LKRKHRFLAICAMALLLLALCLPVLSGALAADEETPIIVPISQETVVFGVDGMQIGTLKSNQTFVPVTGESLSDVIVVYDHATANKAAKSDLLAGKTLVLLSYADATEPTTEKSIADLPQGWIDASFVVTALSARHAVDASTLASKEETIVNLQTAAAASRGDIGVAMDLLADETPNGIFSPERIGTWAPLVALALGVIGTAALVWMAVSNATSACEKERQTRQLIKLNEHLTDGLSIKAPLKVEQIAWPREGRVQIASEALDRMAASAHKGGASGAQMSPYAKPEPEPIPVREGEEPDLLQLANRLAGVASAAEWHAIVRDAGWRAVLLQANPTEKGTYIADDSGYSIIGCLMRTPDAELAYVVPSYQDPNASEPRWSDFYTITEDNSVRNFRVDTLPVMFIERGTFYLPKSKGKLTRRPQKF